MAIDQEKIAKLSAVFDAGFREKDKQKSADLLFSAWCDLHALLNEEGITSQKEAEEKIDWQFGNWINDIDEALFNARRYEDEIELCSTILAIEWDHPLFHENARRSISECYATMGNPAKALELYEGYLKDDPRWGWGWIGYLRLLDEIEDSRFMIELNTMCDRVQSDPDIRNAEDVYDELGNLYADHGETEKADQCYAEGKELAKAKRSFHRFSR